MNWMGKSSPTDRKRLSRSRFARLGIEQLEDRTVPTTASLNVAGHIVGSAEAFGDFTAQAYQTFLQRSADAAGLAGWVNAMQNGLAPEQVEARLASSAEYLALHGGIGADWVTALYHDFLGRAPDTAGLNSWVSAAAATGNAFPVALGFSTSLERDALVINADYQQFFGRTAEASAVASWQTQLQAGLTQTGLAIRLVGSDEFYVRSGATDSGFITRAYQTVLNRTPSLAEIDSWLNAMGDVVPATPGAPQTLLTLTVNPLDINLLGLEVQTNQIQVTVTAQTGQGELLGNLLSDVSNLLNLKGVNGALNNVLSSVVTLLNSASLNVSGVNTSTGPLSTANAATTPVLDLFVAPVHLNLLGAVVDTSPIHLTITAHSGQGLILGNVVADLANLFNPPLPSTLNLDTVNSKLQQLLAELNQQIPGIGSVPTTTPTLPAGSEQILSLTVPPIDVNLLGLVLTTSQIQVNADAQTGNADLLGNVLTTLLNTLGATPANLTALSTNLNAILAKVVGVLNASTLLLPANALNTLTQVLQTLALPNLVNPTGTATTPVLNLTIASSDGTTPPVDVNLLGLVITTSNIQAQIVAQTGDGQVLGNLLYNVSNLLNPGGSLNLLTILNELGL